MVLSNVTSGQLIGFLGVFLIVCLICYLFQYYYELKDFYTFILLQFLAVIISFFID